jgi:hypothetical protein
MHRAAILSKTASTDAGTAGGWARPMLDRQLQVLGDLAEIGLELARAVEAGAKGPDADLDKAVLAYSRVARAVRQTIMLQSRLIEVVQADTARAEAIAARRASVKARMRTLLRRAIDAEHEAPDRAERLTAEAAERLEADLYGDVLTRPVGEIIADICRDLGLDPDWPALQGEIADIEAVVAGEDRQAGEPDRIQVVWLEPRDGPSDTDSS